jgi:hypothetical protein
MALKSWLASLKADISNVSGVQAPIHAGLGRYVTETAGVSGVSGSGGMVASDTADTAREKLTYQAQPAWALACTGDTADTCRKINTETHAANELFSGDLLTVAPTGPKRVFRQRGPWLTGTEPYLHCSGPGQSVRHSLRCGAGALE